MHDAALNPAQAEVLSRLRDGERPSVDPALRQRLLATLDDALAPYGRMLPEGDSLWVGKRTLEQIHGCERNYLAEQEQGFEWTVATARGTVVHKAIDLTLTWRGELRPLELVEEAIARLEADTSRIGEFLAGLPPADRAELSSAANTFLAAFLDGWPRLRPAWQPVTEGRMRVELVGGRIVLSGQPDLMLGTPKGMQAGRLIVDLKTGGFRTAHRDDLRFYALLDTLKLGVPPFRVATYYVESGRIESEDITEEAIDAAARRVVAGIDRLMALRQEAREPAVVPGPACHWCPVRHDCPGVAELNEHRLASGLDPVA